MRAIAQSMPPHVRHRRKPPEAHADILFRRRRREKKGSNMRQRWYSRREATASNSIYPKVNREGQFVTVHIKPVIYTLPRRAYAELLFSCCGNVAALPALANELQWARGQNTYFAAAPAHTQRALNGAHSSRGWSGKKHCILPPRKRARAPLVFPVSLPNYQTKFLTFPHYFPRTNPRVLPASGLFLCA
jgi:hypothetical protein